MDMTSVPQETLLQRTERDGVVPLCMNRPLQFTAFSEAMLCAMRGQLRSTATARFGVTRPCLIANGRWRLATPTLTVATAWREI